MQDYREVNRKILEIISNELELKPELRFIQLLWSLGLINREGDYIQDRFYEPSEITLKKLEDLWQD